MATTFIKFHKTLTDALTVLESPVTTQKVYTGIQLLPFDPLPYRQTTSHPTNVVLEDWTVNVYSLCGKFLADITDSFNVDRLFNDDLGIPQIDWSLKNVQNDFGAQLIYLKISQAVGEDFYTNPFWITEYRKEYTSRFDYRYSVYEPMRSIRLQTWFRQYLNRDELTTYYEVSTKNTVTKSLKTATPAVFYTELFNNELFLLFRNMLNSKFVYCGLRRCSLFEAFEVPTLKEAENFAQAQYLLSFTNEVYDPLYVAPEDTPIVIGDEVPIYAVASSKNRGLMKEYRVVFRIPINNGYNIFLEAFSFVNLNGGAIGFIDIIFGNAENLVISTGFTQNQIMFNQVNLGNFSLRISDGTSSRNYTFTGEVVFTSSDIANGIEKQINTIIA